MREKIYYMLAIAVLLVAIAALVVVFGQNQPSTAQPTQSVQQQSSGNNLQNMFTTLASRSAQNAQYSFRVRVTAASAENTITATSVTVGGTSGAKITDVGTDFFCIANGTSGKVCVPFSQVLSVQLPN
jgi:hypothetical protein